MTEARYLPSIDLQMSSKAESGSRLFSDFAGSYDIVRFNASVKTVHLAVALPKESPGMSKDRLPRSARLDRMAAGRGLTHDQAYQSCLGECVELASASFWGDEAVINATYRDLKGQALHPASLLLASHAQYSTRAVERSLRRF